MKERERRGFCYFACKRCDMGGCQLTSKLDIKINIVHLQPKMSIDIFLVLKIVRMHYFFGEKEIRRQDKILTPLFFFINFTLIFCVSFIFCTHGMWKGCISLHEGENSGKKSCWRENSRADKRVPSLTSNSSKSL